VRVLEMRFFLARIQTLGGTAVTSTMAHVGIPMSGPVCSIPIRTKVLPTRRRGCEGYVNSPLFPLRIRYQYGRIYGCGRKLWCSNVSASEIRWAGPIGTHDGDTGFAGYCVSTLNSSIPRFDVISHFLSCVTMNSSALHLPRIPNTIEKMQKTSDSPATAVNSR
jgi:hypothetical protein